MKPVLVLILVASLGLSVGSVRAVHSQARGNVARPNAGLVGDWQGQWVREGEALDVWLDFTESGAGLAGSFGSDELRVLDIPFRSVLVDSSGVHWVLVGDATTSRFDGTLEGDRLTGTFRDGDARGTFALRRTAKTSTPPYGSEAVHFANRDVTLSGTLFMPSAPGPHPAIVFVQGSGAEGRYASRYLADRFARAGFAALIYDKRGVGDSGGDWKHATFDDLAGDALAALRMLAADPRIRANAIGLHGHSQGGTLAPLIASRWPALAFVIASSAGGTLPAEAETYSYRNVLGVPRLHGADSLRAQAYVDLVVRTAYAGEPWEGADSAAQANAQEKWFSPLPGREDSFWWLAPRIAGYDPARYWRLVRSPVLLLYGERDERVPVEASLHRIRAALGESGTHDVTAKVFPSADHTFRLSGPADGRFHWPRTATGYLETLIDWAKSRTQARRP